MIRCLICVMLLSSSSAAYALEPMLILLLRMLRDQAISSSIEAGVESLRQKSPPQPLLSGFAQPAPYGTEEQRMRALIDESFSYLSSAQRDAVHASMQKILNDPQYAQIRPQIVAEFNTIPPAAGNDRRHE